MKSVLHFFYASAEFWNVYEISDIIEEAIKLLKKYERKYNCKDSIKAWIICHLWNITNIQRKELSLTGIELE